MAAVVVGTSPIDLADTTEMDRSRLLIRNLGPGIVYMDTNGQVDVTTGFPISVGAVYEFPVPAGGMSVFLVSDQADTDVRVVEMG